jgi:hypothetical protein
VKKAVPERSVLGGFPVEESGIQGRDGGRLAEVAAARESCFAKGNEVRGEAAEQNTGELYLFAGADELGVKAERNGVIESDAGHGKGEFPAAQNGFEEQVFLARQGGDPVLQNTTSRTHAPQLAPNRHPGAPERDRRIISSLWNDQGRPRSLTLKEAPRYTATRREERVENREEFHRFHRLSSAPRRCRPKGRPVGL